MSCHIFIGTDLYIGAKMKYTPNLKESFGYAFEKPLLYAQSLGIGTICIGGTMDSGAFEKAMGQFCAYNM